MTRFTLTKAMFKVMQNVIYALKFTTVNLTFNFPYPLYYLFFYIDKTFAFSSHHVAQNKRSVNN